MTGIGFLVEMVAGEQPRNKKQLHLSFGKK
jgi:hypothetical protein